MADYSDIANLSQLQSPAAMTHGNTAAFYADPFMNERSQYADQLQTLMSNPGAMESSPLFKYLTEHAMNATAANNAAGGFRNSGRGLLALQEAAQGSATKAFFPQADLLALLSGAKTGSPAAAGTAYIYGANRSQDLAQQAAAQRAASQNNQNSGGTPWWMQPQAPMTGSQAPGFGAPTSGAYTPGQIAGAGGMGTPYNPYQDPYIMNLMNQHFPGQTPGGTNGGPADANGPRWQYPSGGPTGGTSPYGLPGGGITVTPTPYGGDSGSGPSLADLGAEEY